MTARLDACDCSVRIELPPIDDPERLIELMQALGPFTGGGGWALGSSPLGDEVAATLNDFRPGSAQHIPDDAS